MNVIYKFPLEEAFPISQVTAHIVKPLKVDYQNGIPHLWAVVSDNVPEKTINVFCVGTGITFGNIPSLENYINTTVYQSEPYVWHWFWSDVID